MPNTQHMVTQFNQHCYSLQDTSLLPLSPSTKPVRSSKLISCTELAYSQRRCRGRGAQRERCRKVQHLHKAIDAAQLLGRQLGRRCCRLPCSSSRPVCTNHSKNQPHPLNRRHSLRGHVGNHMNFSAFMQDNTQQMYVQGTCRLCTPLCAQQIGQAESQVGLRGPRDAIIH